MLSLTNTRRPSPLFPSQDWSLIVSQITEGVKELRASGFECGKPLSRGRRCVHLKNHDSRCSGSWNGFGSPRPEEPNSPYFQTLNHDQTQSLEIDVTTGEVTFESSGKSLSNYTEVEPGVYMPEGSEAEFHSPNLTPEEYESWLARDAEFTDVYADWMSGTSNPLIGKHFAHPEEVYAMSVLRGYLPGFAEAEEAVDPYKENTSPSHRHRGPSPYSMNDKRKAVMMAERLGIRKTARKLGIPYSTLKSWIKSYKENTSTTPAKPTGRPRGQRSDKPCMGCGKPTRTHIDHKPLCRPCYVKSEEYRLDRNQWKSDMIVLRKAINGG